MAVKQMHCPYCQHVLSRTANRCPNCANKLARAKMQTTWHTYLAVAIVFSVAILSLLLSGTYDVSTHDVGTHDVSTDDVSTDMDDGDFRDDDMDDGDFRDDDMDDGMGDGADDSLSPRFGRHDRGDTPSRTPPRRNARRNSSARRRLNMNYDRTTGRTAVAAVATPNGSGPVLCDTIAHFNTIKPYR